MMPAADLSSDSRVMALLEGALELRLVSLLFECPDGEWKERVETLAENLRDKDLLAASAAAVEEASEGLYHTVLGPGGPAPPREISHRDVIQSGRLLAEISEFYNAFAYRPASREAPDHIAVETGFLAYLRLKEAYARLRGRDAEADVTAEAALRFTREHLSALAAPFTACAGTTGVVYLHLAGDALVQRVGKPEAPRSQAETPAVARNVFDCPAAGFACGGEPTA